MTGMIHRHNRRLPPLAMVDAPKQACRMQTVFASVEVMAPHRAAQRRAADPVYGHFEGHAGGMFSILVQYNCNSSTAIV